MTIVSVEELRSARKQKEDKTKVAYKSILEECSRRIRLVNDKGLSSMVYTIPGIIPDTPLYDVYQALAYVVRKLQKNGFTVVPIDCKVYISWNTQKNHTQPPPHQQIPAYHVVQCNTNKHNRTHKEPKGILKKHKSLEIGKMDDNTMMQRVNELRQNRSRVNWV